MVLCAVHCNPSKAAYPLLRQGGAICSVLPSQHLWLCSLISASHSQHTCLACVCTAVTEVIACAGVALTLTLTDLSHLMQSTNICIIGARNVYGST